MFMSKWKTLSDLEITLTGGATLKPARDVVCSLLLTGRLSHIAMTLSAKIDVLAVKLKRMLL